MRKTILPAWHVVLLRRRLIRTRICFVTSHFCSKRYMHITRDKIHRRTLAQRKVGQDTTLIPRSVKEGGEAS
jgi:hypothetical protein